MELGKLCDVVRGSSPRPRGDPRYYGGKIPRLMVADLTRDGMYVTPQIDFLTEKGAKLSRPMKKGDVIVAVSGNPGLPAILNSDACIHDGFVGFRNLNTKFISNKFLYHYLKFNKEQTNSKAVGAIFKNLTTDQLKEIEIPLPDLKTQQKIASILEQADTARQKRKQANQLTEQFLQSAFLEMFGDPEKNEKKWMVKNFSYGATIEKNAIQSKDISPNDLYVGLEHIEKDSGKLLGFQKTNTIELKSTKFKFTDKHILYGKLRPYLNKVCFPNISGVCSTDILPIKPNEKIADKHFVGYLMKQPFFTNKATSMSNGANLPRISPKTLETFEIILPPLPLQQKFASLVERVEKLRGKQRESEKELENLFQSLMQKYFG